MPAPYPAFLPGRHFLVSLLCSPFFLTTHFHPGGDSFPSSKRTTLRPPSQSVWVGAPFCFLTDQGRHLSSAGLPPTHHRAALLIKKPLPVIPLQVLDLPLEQPRISLGHIFSGVEGAFVSLPFSLLESSSSSLNSPHDVAI